MKCKNLNHFLILNLSPVLLSFLHPDFSIALESKANDEKTSANEMNQKAKKEYEELKDKSCEVFDGKLECKVKKVKTKGKSWIEKMETSSLDPENNLIE